MQNNSVTMQYSHSLIFFRHSYFSAMVNKFVSPTSSSSPSIPLQTSSSVSSSEQQTYPSHNNIEELYNKNINIETIGVNRNLNKKPNVTWSYSIYKMRFIYCLLVILTT